MHRRILHVDMDAFFASVEQRDHPELRGKPIVVGGTPGGRGVVAAASYQARAFGIHSAMPAGRALRLCPDLIFVRPDFGRYKAASEQIFEIFRSWTPHVEGLSLDEAFLDVTENLRGVPSGTQVARLLRAEIFEATGLTASAGVAPVKFVAKIASDYRKPDGLTVVRPEQVLDFIHPLPVEKLWGVGPATAKRLHAVGLRTIADVYARPEHELVEALGSQGRWLATLSRGQDPRPVRSRRGRKSISAERTFAQDSLELGALQEILAEQSQRIAESLKSQGWVARTVVLKLRYDDFSTLTRSKTPERPLGAAQAILSTGLALLDKTDAGLRPVRLIGLGVSGLSKPQGPSRQLELDLH